MSSSVKARGSGPELPARLITAVVSPKPSPDEGDDLMLVMSLGTKPRLVWPRRRTV
jgi:hypothetical protein